RDVECAARVGIPEAERVPVPGLRLDGEPDGDGRQSDGGGGRVDELVREAQEEILRITGARLAGRQGGDVGGREPGVRLAALLEAGAARVQADPVAEPEGKRGRVVAVGVLQREA